MGLEQRKNGMYYYRKRRIGDRVVSEYRGGGVCAAILSEQQAMRHAGKVHLQAERRDLQDAMQERAQAVLETEEHLRTLTAAVLLVNGFVQHKRQWRKGNDMVNEMQRMRSIDPAPIAAPPGTDEGDDALRALREAIVGSQPEPSANGRVPLKQRAGAELERRVAVRDVLNKNPHIWLRMRATLGSVEGRILAATRDQASKDILTYHLVALRSSLGYDTAPVLEQLLIEQVLIAWLDLDTLQRIYAEQVLGSHSPATGQYFDRRLTGAQARFLRASEALARIRRLAMPMPLQVNIGGQQVNVAGDVRAGGSLVDERNTG